MSFTLQLTPDLVSVEPGASAPISIVLQNRGGTRERYEMEIEGVDPEWKAVPVPVFEAESGEKHSERFFFKPPRASESVAGDYPFVVRVRSLVSGETQIVQGVLQIKPFHHLSMEVSPKRGIVSPAHRNSSFDVTIVNLGNSEHTVRISANDAEEECAYEIEADQVTVAPGAQRQVEVTASPKRNPWFTSGRLVGIAFSARSVDTPSVVSTSQAQLEQRPLLSLTTLAVAIVCAVVLLAWFFARPKPIYFTVVPDHNPVTAGDQVTITWTLRGGDHVLIKTPSEVIYNGPIKDGSQTFTASTSGTLDVEAIATQDGGDEKRLTIPIDVRPKPEVDPPVIESANWPHGPINLGESFKLTYHLGPSVTKATLEPDNIDLPTDLNEVLVKPTVAGDIEYMIDAQNQNDQHVNKSFRVSVVEKSDASILLFDVEPKQVTPDNNTVTVSWNVSTNAGLVQLFENDGQPIQEDLTGKAEFQITANTEFKLVAKDQKGRATSAKQFVKYVAPKPPETPPGGFPGGQPNPNDTTTAGTPPTTNGTTTGTTGTTAGGAR